MEREVVDTLLLFHEYGQDTSCPPGSPVPGSPRRHAFLAHTLEYGNTLHCHIRNLLFYIPK